MTSIQFLASLSLFTALVSCAPQADMYDTSDSYATPDASANVEPTPAPENAIYDTPAVYEENSAVTAPAPAAVTPAAVTPAAVSPSVTTTTHTVVRGDTLSGISKKYRVPMESIKRANNMTNDIVVLGRVMTIPSP